MNELVGCLRGREIIHLWGGLFFASHHRQLALKECGK